VGSHVVITNTSRVIGYDGRVSTACKQRQPPNTTNVASVQPPQPPMTAQIAEIAERLDNASLGGGAAFELLANDDASVWQPTRDSDAAERSVSSLFCVFAACCYDTVIPDTAR
jgi:hypothetical protein